MTKRSMKDSRQAGMTILKDYVNLLNAFTIVCFISKKSFNFFTNEPKNLNSSYIVLL